MDGCDDAFSSFSFPSLPPYLDWWVGQGRSGGWLNLSVSMYVFCDLLFGRVFIVFYLISHALYSQNL